MKIGYYRHFEGMIQQEHERIIYFEQYLYRVHRQLQELFNELDTIHQEVFGKPTEQKGEEAIKNLVGNLYPTACKNVTSCARKEGTNKDTWAWCETGVSETCLELYKPPEIKDPNNPEDLKKLKECPHWKKESPLKSLRIPIALLSVMVIAIIILVFSVNPAPDVVLGKTSSLQELEMNQSLNVSLALTNKGSDSITDITITDEVPSEGFILTEGNTTRNEELLEQGKTIFMNYTLKALQAGSYDLKPAKASYALNGSSHTISSKSITINVNEEGNTSLSQGASVITPNSTPG
jgi:hypothetical protein